MAFILNPRGMYRFSRKGAQSLTQLPSRSIIYFEDMDKLEKMKAQMNQKPPTDKDVLFPGIDKMINKTYGFHRDFKIPKMANHFDIYAKKIREMYLKERYLPGEIPVLTELRKRRPGDLMEVLKKKRELPVVVAKRDEWNKDLNLVGRWRLATYLSRADAGHCRQYELDYGEGEPIRVILSNILSHFMQKYPMRIVFNRFVIGRPNPITVPIMPINENNCNDRMLGANVHMPINDLDLWTYTEVYPPQIQIDLSHLAVNEPIKLGDVEKLLPDGVFLHKKYNHRLHHSVIKLEETKLYKGKMAIAEHNRQEFLKKKREIELADAMKKKTNVQKKKKRKKIQNPLHRSRNLV